MRGLVSSPHTSAGKVPTHHGLRFFVESLLSFQPLDDEAVGQMRHELNPDLFVRVMQRMQVVSYIMIALLTFTVIVSTAM